MKNKQSKGPKRVYPGRRPCSSCYLKTNRRLSLPGFGIKFYSKQSPCVYVIIYRQGKTDIRGTKKLFDRSKKERRKK